MRDLTDLRFHVIDLGTQLGERQFAVWDATVRCFWKINHHQTWRSTQELVADYEVRFPGDKLLAVARHQRDVVIAKAVALGFPGGDASRDGRTVAEKLLLDELCGTKAQVAELTQRLALAHSAHHVEQVAHDETKANLLRLERAKVGVP